MMEAVAKAEGTGYGVTVGASAKYQESKAYSENSVSFVSGETIKHGRRLYKNYEQLAVLDTVQFREKLRNKPEEFRAEYGDYFVAEIITGASFSSSITIKDKYSASSSDMSAFLSVKSPFAAAEGGFSSAASGASSNIEIKIERFTRGGSTQQARRLANEVSHHN
jgi:hypothetical protein